MSTPTLRRAKCTMQVREFRDEDLKIFNSPWDFWGQNGLGPDEWGFAVVSTCKHTYEVMNERAEGDTTYREFFQCTKCNEKMFVRIMFGCPVCKGRHLQFWNPEWSTTFVCPDKPIVPFYKKDIRGAHLEVSFSS